MRQPRTDPAASRGVTMIELMVAVTISLFITLVIAQLFLGSRQTFATTDDVSRMQENIRYTQHMLTRNIHIASYKSNPNELTVANGGMLGVFDPPNEALSATDGGGTNSDSLTLRYQGSGDGSGAADGTVVDCVGAKVDSAKLGSAVFAVNRFYIAPGANGRNALFCSNTGVLPPVNDGVEMVPNVVNMQVLFGEDTNSPFDYTANRYVPFSGVANMANVISVRIALLFETPTDTSKTLPDDRKYNMFGDLPPTVELGPFTDRRIRRIVTMTINLRNRTP